MKQALINTLVTIFALLFPSMTTANPLAGKKFYLNSENTAATWVAKNRTAPEAKVIQQIATVPQGIWLNDENGPSTVKNHLAKCGMTIPVFVLYAIPNRDKGQHSAGGQKSQADYEKLVTDIAKAIGNKKVVLILEPDALTLLGEDATTTSTLTKAVEILKKNTKTFVYIDAGHSNWHPADVVAARLKSSGIDKADGFCLNTSNFRATPELIAFGSKVSGLVNRKHFVLDTSRNGNGPFDGEGSKAWCNPPGRRIGALPTTQTGHPLVDAFIWVKCPGESDGPEDGAPKAGEFWPQYAAGLITNPPLQAAR